MWRGKYRKWVVTTGLKNKNTNTSSSFLCRAACLWLAFRSASAMFLSAESIVSCSLKSSLWFSHFSNSSLIRSISAAFSDKSFNSWSSCKSRHQHTNTSLVRRADARKDIWMKLIGQKWVSLGMRKGPTAQKNSSFFILFQNGVFWLIYEVSYTTFIAIYAAKYIQAMNNATTVTRVTLPLLVQYLLPAPLSQTSKRSLTPEVKKS